MWDLNFNEDVVLQGLSGCFSTQKTKEAENKYSQFFDRHFCSRALFIECAELLILFHIQPIVLPRIRQMLQCLNVQRKSSARQAASVMSLGFLTMNQFCVLRLLTVIHIIESHTTTTTRFTEIESGISYYSYHDLFSSVVTR